MAAFLAGLCKGLKVRDAARAAGLAANTFYNHRRRCPDFADDRDEAVERSAAPVMLRPPSTRLRTGPSTSLRTGPSTQLRTGKRRRLRFGAMRQEIFLETLARCCDTKASAEAAGVHVSAVYRRIKRDPAFALENRAALERGYARLEKLAALEREAAAERMRNLPPIEPRGEMTRDFDEMMRLMRRWERPREKRRAQPERRRALTHSEAVDSLIDKLGKVFGSRMPASGGGEAAGA